MFVGFITYHNKLNRRTFENNDRKFFGYLNWTDSEFSSLFSYFSAEISNDGSPNSPDFSSVQFTQFLNVSSDSDGGSSDENENGKSGKKSHSEKIKNTSAKSERSKAR